MASATKRIIVIHRSSPEDSVSLCSVSVPICGLLARCNQSPGRVVEQQESSNQPVNRWRIAYSSQFPGLLRWVPCTAQEIDIPHPLVGRLYWVTWLEWTINSVFIPPLCRWWWRTESFACLTISHKSEADHVSEQEEVPDFWETKAAIFNNVICVKILL